MAIGRKLGTTQTSTVFDGTATGAVSGTPVNSENINCESALSISLFFKADDQGGTPDGVVKFEVFGGLDSTVANHGVIAIWSSGNWNLATLDPQSYPVTLPVVDPHIHVKATRVSGAAAIWPTLQWRIGKGDPASAEP